jgi:hypothetical protein
MRSMQSRIAAGSPRLARATRSSTNSCARSNSAAFAASVFLLRLPTARPAGLPLCPGWKVMSVVPLSLSLGRHCERDSGGVGAHDFNTTFRNPW